MSFERVGTPDGERFVDVTCDRCHAPLVPDPVTLDSEGRWRCLQTCEGLHLRVDGGYGEFVDLFSQADTDECHLLFCTRCAVEVVRVVPEIAQVVRSHVNLNVGHVCVDGQLSFEPMPTCERSVDAHGWRELWVLRPTGEARSMVLGVYESESDAARECVEGYEVHEVLSANLAHFYDLSGAVALPTWWAEVAAGHRTEHAGQPVPAESGG